MTLTSLITTVTKSIIWTNCKRWIVTHFNRETSFQYLNLSVSGVELTLLGDDHLSQNIQEWTKYNLWKTAFKYFDSFHTTLQFTKNYCDSLQIFTFLWFWSFTNVTMKQWLNVGHLHPVWSLLLRKCIRGVFRTLPYIYGGAFSQK